MINIDEVLYKKVKAEMDKWSDTDIYAVSFFVNSNEAHVYNGFENVSDFCISYNTESNCDGAEEFSEERWNYAFWLQDETYIIDTHNNSAETELLFEWYKENGLHNLGIKNNDDCYDDAGYYIGKGPVGHYELLQIVANIAKRLQSERYLETRFGKIIPIIVHGLEYAWYDVEATKIANPNNEAGTFIAALEKLGMI